MSEKNIGKVETVVLASAIVLVLIGVAEILVGYFADSVGLLADGIDSISDSFISFMVWFGLRISKRSADKRFHFGYYRVETLVSMIVAIIMVVMSIYIFHIAYLRIINPSELNYPVFAMAMLLVSGLISLWISLVKIKLAKMHNLLSLKADANTSIKDWTSSFVILGGLLLSDFRFKWGDSLGAVIVGIYILSVAATTIRGASLILIDGFNNPELVKDISRIIQKYDAVRIKDLKLRMSGPYILGEITLTVDGSMSVRKVFGIKNTIKNEIMQKISGVKDLVILADPDSVENLSSLGA